MDIISHSFPNPETKLCTKCGEPKPLSEYYVKVKATGRLFSWCKDCQNKRSVNWQVENRERFNENARNWRKANYEHYSATSKNWRKANHSKIRERELKIESTPEYKAKKAAYRLANHERRLAYNANYREAHKDQIRESNRLYRETNHDLIKERHAEWRSRNTEKVNFWGRLWKSNPANKAARKAQSNNRRAKILNNGGTFTGKEWEALKEYYGYQCLMCGKCEPEIKLTVDHIVPVSKGGSNDISNIQPLCKSCNSKKHRKVLNFRK